MIIQIILFTIFLTFINIITGFGRSSVLGCGLVGFSGKNPVNLSIINFLLWHNAETRGKHATGIFTPNTGIVKQGVEALTYIKNKENQFKIKLDNVLMGHVRKATVGSDVHNVNNAHPFDFGRLVMQHNGTLTNYKQLAKSYELNADSWNIDSQVLGMILNKNLKDHEPFKVLEEYEGAAAYIMYDKDTDVLYAGHDDERTLFYGYIGEDMYISSIDVSLEIIGCVDIKPFPEFVVHTIKDGKIINTKSYTKKAKTEVKKINKLAASLLNIFEFSKGDVKKFFFKEDNKFTGIVPSGASSYLLGYHIECLTNITPANNSDLAKLTKGKFYKIDSARDINSFYMIDDDNNKKVAYKGNFNINYYIPIKGNNVTILNNEGYENVDKDESYEVVYHRFSDNFVIIKDNKNNNISIDLKDCRVSTEEEINNTYLPIQQFHNEVGFTIVKKDDEPKTLFDDEDLEEEVQELDLLQEAVDNLLLTITDQLSEIALNPNLKLDVDTTLALMKLDNFIEACYDSKFLLNVNSNTYKNFETVKEEIC